MTTTSYPQGRVAHGPLANTRADTMVRPLPSWWCGPAHRWLDIAGLHAQLVRLEATPMRICRLGVYGAVLGGAGAVHAGFAHAMPTAGLSGIDYGALAFGCLGIFLLSVWAYEVALTLRGRNADHCAELWVLLVAATREGCVDARQLGLATGQETEAESSLRQEFQTVQRYLASAGVLRPRLNSYSRRMFGLCPATPPR